MPNQKITAFASVANVLGSMIFPVVSAAANKQVTQRTLLKSIGIVQYAEATVLATTQIVSVGNVTITDMKIKAMIASSAQAGGSQILIGVPADQQRFVGNGFANSVTSGFGFYGPGASVAAFQNFSGIITGAAPTASAASIFVVGVSWIQN